MENVFEKEVLEKQNQLQTEIKKYIFGDNNIEYKRLIEELDAWETEVFKLIYKHNGFVSTSDFEKWSKEHDGTDKNPVIYEDDNIKIISFIDYDFGYCFAELSAHSKSDNIKVNFQKIFGRC